MNPWTSDFLFGVALIITAGIGIGLTQPLSTLLFWIGGLALGYGLRIGIVNMWPHVFKPRIAYGGNPSLTVEKNRETRI